MAAPPDAASVGLSAFPLANLVDFPPTSGHRNASPGFDGAPRHPAPRRPMLLSAKGEDDLLSVTADHANGPNTPGEDLESRTLRERALAAMERAYAPYSNIRVGAALLGGDGSISEGCNVENAAYPVGTCAERAALASAVVRGVRAFRRLCITTTASTPAPPCGMCRQALYEFSPDLEIVSIARSGRVERWRLTDLLPHAFTMRSLDHDNA